MPDPAAARWTDDDLTVATQAAYEAGYTRALELAAQRVDELRALWKPIQRHTQAELIAERVAEMERAARRLRRDIRSEPWPDVVTATPGAPAAAQPGRAA